jgi:serine/threonine protein kinase
VLTTGGIRALADVLATMREPQLRGLEANELELPYLAPEVLTGHVPDACTDLFTVGVVAYQLVTGRVPYHAPTLPELIGQMLTAAPAPLRTADVPEPAAAAIMRCLDADPAARGTLADLQTIVRQHAAA